MKYIRSVLILLFLNALNPILINASAQEDTSYQSVTFDSNSILSIDNSTTVSGYVTSNQNLITLSWKLEYSEILYDSGELLFQAQSDSFQNPTYQWQIFLDFQSFLKWLNSFSIGMNSFSL